MLKVKPEYLSKRGRRELVVLTVEDFQRIKAALDDAEDLRRHAQECRGFVLYRRGSGTPVGTALAAYTQSELTGAARARSSATGARLRFVPIARPAVVTHVTTAGTVGRVLSSRGSRADDYSFSAAGSCAAAGWASPGCPGASAMSLSPALGMGWKVSLLR